MPKYDPDALQKNIDRFKKQIEVFEAEIKKYREQILEYTILLHEAKNERGE